MAQNRYCATYSGSDFATVRSLPQKEKPDFSGLVLIGTHDGENSHYSFFIGGID